MSALETARLRLRLLREDGEGDAALYVQLYGDDAVMRHIVAPLAPERAGQAFARACRHNRATRPGHRTWRVDDRVDGAGLGIVALQRAGGAAEIGVVLRESAWGHGIGREALVGVLGLAFSDLGLALVYGERPDDGQARLVDRMFGPLGLARVPASPGKARWELPVGRWAAAQAEHEEV